MSAVRRKLDEHRWHFQHGPIDLVLEADSEDAIERAWERFDGLLEELVAELPLLRSRVQCTMSVEGAVARRMTRACWPHRGAFITPMAAVAGAVADELIAAMRSDERLRRAYVNNGGDIALHLAPGERFRIGVVANLHRHGAAPALDGRFEVRADLQVRGIATSGWRGRSWSLGIADSVTVLASDAAAADAAATMIANAVNHDHPAVHRRRACEVDDNTDLGERLVTVHVGVLPEKAVAAALDGGAAQARALRQAGIIWGAVLMLQSRQRVIGGAPALLRARAGAAEEIVYSPTTLEHTLF